MPQCEVNQMRGSQSVNLTYNLCGRRAAHKCERQGIKHWKILCESSFARDEIEK